MRSATRRKFFSIEAGRARTNLRCPERGRSPGAWARWVRGRETQRVDDVIRPAAVFPERAGPEPPSARRISYETGVAGRRREREIGAKPAFSQHEAEHGAGQHEHEGATGGPDDSARAPRSRLGPCGVRFPEHESSLAALPEPRAVYSTPRRGFHTSACDKPASGGSSRAVAPRESDCPGLPQRLLNETLLQGRDINAVRREHESADGAAGHGCSSGVLWPCGEDGRSRA